MPRRLGSVESSQNIPHNLGGALAPILLTNKYMKKKVKIFIDNGPIPHGWIGVKNFPEFSDLLETLKISEIEMISFSDNLEDNDEDAISAFSGTDCAVRLIQCANGEQLPQCFVHDNSQDIAETLNYYTKSYKHDNICIIHTIEEIA